MLYALIFVIDTALIIAIMMSIPYIFRWGMGYFRKQEEKKWKKERGIK